jgi:hypothetical protein
MSMTAEQIFIVDSYHSYTYLNWVGFNFRAVAMVAMVNTE